MIEFSRAEIEDFNPPNPALTLARVRFYEYRVKIDGVEYNIQSKEFEDAWNKEICWRKLSAVPQKV